MTNAYINKKWIAEIRNRSQLQEKRIQALVAAITNSTRSNNPHWYREFYMSIPAQPDHDADLILAQLQRDREVLLKAEGLLRAENERLIKALQNAPLVRHISNFTGELDRWVEIEEYDEWLTCWLGPVLTDAATTHATAAAALKEQEQCEVDPMAYFKDMLL